MRYVAATAAAAVGDAVAGGRHLTRIPSDTNARDQKTEPLRLKHLELLNCK